MPKSSKAGGVRAKAPIVPKKKISGKVPIVPKQPPKGDSGGSGKSKSK